MGGCREYLGDRTDRKERVTMWDSYGGWLEVQGQTLMRREQLCAVMYG